MGQIFLIKNEYKKASSCYEKGYYLNLGRYGAENSITDFCKKKLENINEDLKNNIYIPLPKDQIVNNTIIQSYRSSDDNSSNNSENNSIGNILHKGKAETFSFKIPTSPLYEPLTISIYSIGNDDNRYSPELFLGELSFDKQKLARYLRLNKTRFNGMFYTDENLNIILGNIICNNKILQFLDKNLKSCLISTSCQIL